MRIDVKKFLFVGRERNRARFFSEAQELGLVQFIDPLATKVLQEPKEIADLQQAIKILRHQTVVAQEESEDLHFAMAVAEESLSLDQQLLNNEEAERHLELEIQRIEIFGQFSLNEIRAIEQESKRVFQFFFSRSGYLDPIDLPDGLVFVGTANHLDYFVSIQPTRTSYEQLIEMQVEHSYEELKEKLARLKQENQQIESRLKELAKYLNLLQHAYIHELNQLALKKNQQFAQTVEQELLFAVEGWVPANKIDAIRELCSQSDVWMDEVAIESHETVPTYLENQGVGRVGEDLVHIYDTPSASDKDPSLWVLFAFAFFFAFIVADAGYGLVFLAVAIYLQWKSVNPKPASQRFFKLLTILAVACVGWGVLISSFFGVSIAPDSPLRKVSLTHWLAEKKAEYHAIHKDEVYASWIEKLPELQWVEEPKALLHAADQLGNQGVVSNEMLTSFTDQLMMELALFVGLIHLTLSFLRYARKNPIGLGWVLVMWGCYLFIPYYMQTTSMTQYLFHISPLTAYENGIILLLIGFAYVIVTALLIHRLSGLVEIMNAIQVFSDVLSYLRLYALALAGAIIAGIINEFAEQLPFIFAILLIVTGHLVNIVLATMGGVIHGLRLNFLEWYHYSFEGGGKPFQALRKIRVE